MFIYLVALVATTFLIFGLVAYARPQLAERLQSSVRYPLTLYNDLGSEFLNQPSINREDVPATLPSGRSLTAISERSEYESPHVQRATLGNKERSSHEILREGTSKWESLGLPRYSFESMLKNETEKNFGLSGARAVEPEVTRSDSIKISKQDENKDNILHLLKNSIQKTHIVPPNKLNSSHIYNLILKETMKENAAQQKPAENNVEFRGLFSAKRAEDNQAGQQGRSDEDDASN